MTTDAHTTSYHGADLLRAAAAATEQAPQLAEEIRAHSRTVAARVSSGGTVTSSDIDVRTLLGLIQQSGVQVPVVSRRAAAGA